MVWNPHARKDCARNRNGYASDMTDGEWIKISDLFPKPAKTGRPRTTCFRRVINAIFYLLQSGCQWDMLPKSFPPWQTVYRYFSRGWQDDGGKKVNGRKRHIVVDILGMILRAEVHSAGIQDRNGAEIVLNLLINRLPFIETIIADGGYAGQIAQLGSPRPLEMIMQRDFWFCRKDGLWKGHLLGWA